jgi:hypothetical protein
LEATRVRFGSILEWLLAAAVFVAVLAVAEALYRDVRAVRPVVPVMAGEAPVHDAPPGLPARSLSVPMLSLRGGGELRVGDAASQVAALLAGAAQVLSESLEQGRITRVYDAFGVRFVIVFEERDGAEPRVAAIYHQ